MVMLLFFLLSLVLLRAHVRRALTLSSGFLNAKLTWTLINDVCFWSKWNSLWCSFKKGLCTHINLSIQLFESLRFLREYFGIVYILQMQGDQLIIFCAFWHEKLWRSCTIELFLSSGSNMHSARFLSGFDWPAWAQPPLTLKESPLASPLLPKPWILTTLSNYLGGCQLDESKSLNKYSNSTT